MNIFCLSHCPIESAKWVVDRHVVKMPTETAQILCSVFWHNGFSAPMKQTHRNHPCCVFARTSLDNFNWTVQHGIALCEEYTARYGRTHGALKTIEWCNLNKSLLTFNTIGRTNFATAIATDAQCRQITGFEQLDVVEKYRLFYQIDKAHLHKWKQSKPYWIQ